MYPSGPQPLSLGQQAGSILATCPDFQCGFYRHVLVAHGPLQPLPLCEVYLVRLIYAFGSRPRPIVLSPRLRRRGDEKIPHTYGPDEPCVYDPNEHQWHPGLPLATTIIPWLSLWLFHYENWRATGDWQGGGRHPERRVRRRRRRR